MTTAISPDRWQAAQAAEREYWYPPSMTAQRALLEEERARLRWIAGLLDVHPDTVSGRSVMDIAGGPCTMLRDFDLGRRVLVDPLPLSNGDLDALACAGVERFAVMAEGFDLGTTVDEVWGYNALQHVIDPAAVMETAKRHATHVIRWFEWIDQPLATVHPHTISAAFLGEHLTGWKRVTWTLGLRDESRGWCQGFAAGVWVR